jgi:hypothetical protein
MSVLQAIVLSDDTVSMIFGLIAAVSIIGMIVVGSVTSLGKSGYCRRCGKENPCGQRGHS